MLMNVTTTSNIKDKQNRYILNFTPQYQKHS